MADDRADAHLRELRQHVTRQRLDGRYRYFCVYCWEAEYADPFEVLPEMAWTDALSHWKEFHGLTVRP